MRKFREKIKSGEVLAVKADSHADIMDLLMADEVVPNENRDRVCIVTVRGPLEHHNCGYGDSYDQISCRLTDAMSDDETDCVVMRIDSPGGVVSGLNQMVYAHRRTKTKKVYVYVDEMAASAAYALACIGDEIYVPSAGITGSIGVISTICEQSAADKKAGLNFVTITSGARKADGHPHVPLSDGAVKAETARVEKLAAQFFKLVQRSRGIDAEPLQAGIFLGKDGVTKGLADGVMGFDELLATISLDATRGVVSPSPKGQSVPTGSKTTQETTQMLKIKAMIAKWEAQLAKGGSPSKMLALAGNVEAAKKTYKKMTEEETEETNDHEEEADEDASEDADEESGGNDTDRDEGAPPPPPSKDKKKDDDSDDDSDDDDDSAEEESEEEDAKKERKAAASLRKMAATSKGGIRAQLLESAKAIEAAGAKRKAVRGENKMLRKVTKQVEAIQQDRTNDKRDQLVAKLLREGRVTPAEAKKELASATLATVQTWEKARPRAIVRSLSDKLNADLSVDAQSIGRNLGGAPDSVIHEVTQEMREAAARVAQLTNGKVTAEQSLEDYTSKSRRS